MKVKYNKRTGRWIPDEPKNYKKIFNDKLSNLKRIIKLKYYSCWLWLYLYPYLSIRKMFGLKMTYGFWLFVYKQEEHLNKFSKYKR